MTEFGQSLVGLIIRRLPWLVAATLLGGLLGYLIADGSSDPEYEARSLVVATRWEQRIEGLARMVETVIETNDYRQQIQSLDPVAFPDGATFERSVDVVPVQDTVAVWVEAVAPDPDTAQRRANAASDTLVLELNRLGDDIGVFAVQDRAPLPTGPLEPAIGEWASAALGALGGFIIASGIAVAIPGRRRSSDGDADPTSVAEAEPTRIDQGVSEPDVIESATRESTPDGDTTERASALDVLDLPEAEPPVPSVRRIDPVPRSELPPMHRRKRRG